MCEGARRHSAGLGLVHDRKIAVKNSHVGGSEGTSMGPLEKTGILIF